MYAAEEGHLDAIKILVEQKSVAVDDYDLVNLTSNG